MRCRGIRIPNSRVFLDVRSVVWNIFQCKSAREPRAENKSSRTMLHHIFEQLFSGSTMRGRQLGSNTGRGGWAEGGQAGSAHRASDGHKPDKIETKLISGIVRQFIVILIYSRYTKHARRSNFNFMIDIRDWTLTDSVRINLNYSGSIFVFWCPSQSPEWPLLTDQCHNLLVASVTAPAPRDHDWDLWCSCK